MSTHQLAQLNVAVGKAPLDSPAMADFVANLERINALAEASDGFVWRLKDDDPGARAALRSIGLGPETLVNLSVWRDAAALEQYVYRSAHVEIMRRRKEWFERLQAMHMVLWWVPVGHRPGVAEAVARLRQLCDEGPGPDAFTFREVLPAPDACPAA